MSLLQVTTGKQIGAQIHVIAGDNGVGKTTWAASAPKPIILDLEDGSKHLDVARLSSEQIPNLEKFRAIIKELIEAKHEYQTVVIDSVESLESMICDQICIDGKVDSIERWEGGFGKGYARSREIMKEVMEDLKVLKAKGITSILVAHTQVKQKSDPVTNQSYDRVIMRCNDKMSAVVRDLSDNVFYATYKVFTTSEKGKTKAFGDGQRVMFTQWRPSFDAKNRLELPLEMPLSYEVFADYVTKAPEANVETLISDINQIAEGADAQIKKSTKELVEKFKTNPVKLKELKNRLMTAVSKGA